MILVDEVQDLPAEIVKELKKRSDKVICAGDENQSIYENTVSSSEIQSLLNAQTFGLKIIHRLTKTLKKIASLFKSDVLGAKEDWNKTDVDVIIGKGQSFGSEQEFEYVWKSAKSEAKNIPTVILLPFHSSIAKFMNFVLSYENKPLLDENMNDNEARNKHLDKHNVKLEYIGNGFGSLEGATNNHKVMIMTYHSAKGLDFESVYIPNLYETMVIWRKSDKTEDLEMSKTLFFVAVTRSRRKLFISYSAKRPHKFVSLIENECKIQEISQLLTQLNQQEKNLSSFDVAEDDITF